jgi:hypothetical protein
MDRRTKRSLSLSEIRLGFADWVKNFLPREHAVRYMPEESPKAEPTNTNEANSDAVFLGWQRTPQGEVFALYNVIAKEHPLYRSTVSGKTLYEQRLEIPPTPFPQGQVKRFDYEK